MAVKINLGERVKDKVSGVFGIVINYFFHLNGCQYVEFEPDAKDGVRVESVYMAEDRVEHFPGFNSSITPITPDISNCHVKLGDKVKDTVSGFTGHAVIIQIPLFGAGRVAIEPPMEKDGKLGETQFFDEQRIEVIEVKAPPVAEAMPEERKKRGCAPSSAKRYLQR